MRESQDLERSVLSTSTSVCVGPETEAELEEAFLVEQMELGEESMMLDSSVFLEQKEDTDITGALGVPVVREVVGGGHSGHVPDDPRGDREMPVVPRVRRLIKS